MRYLLVFSLLLCSNVLAHATLVLGTLETTPSPAQAGRPLTLTMTLLDLTQVPVEDAWVLAEFRHPSDEAPLSTRFEETQEAGVYEATVQLPQAADYTLLLRDQTFRQEEAQATLTFPVGRVPAEPLEFVFPPTATGVSAWTWIGFLIGLPVLAGGAVTTLVLLKGKGEAEASQQVLGGAAAEPQE